MYLLNYCLIFNKEIIDRGKSVAEHEVIIKAQTCSSDPIMIQLDSQQRSVETAKKPLESIGHVVNLIVAHLNH